MARAPEAQPWLRANHGHVADASHHVAQLLREYAEGDLDHLEFEFRLGRWSDSGAFVPDVGPQLFDRLIGPSVSGKCHSAHGPPMFGVECPQSDYWYLQTVDGVRRELRTRVHYDHAALNIGSETIYKEALGRVDVRVSGSNWGIRFDAKREVPVPAVESFGIAVPTTRCSIASKSTAVLVSRQHGDRPMWRLEASRRWDGATRSDAERSAAAGDGAHTVEIEYIGGAEALQSCGAAYVACSGLLKALRILGCDGAPCELHRVVAGAPSSDRKENRGLEAKHAAGARDSAE
jgi:hypothetical protein